MNVVAVLIMAVYAVMGGVSTLFFTVSLPGIIGWKIYRKVKYHKALTD